MRQDLRGGQSLGRLDEEDAADEVFGPLTDDAPLCGVKPVVCALDLRKERVLVPVVRRKGGVPAGMVEEEEEEVERGGGELWWSSATSITVRLGSEGGQGGDTHHDARACVRVHAVKTQLAAGRRVSRSRAFRTHPQRRM